MEKSNGRQISGFKARAMGHTRGLTVAAEEPKGLNVKN